VVLIALLAGALGAALLLGVPASRAADPGPARQAPRSEARPQAPAPRPPDLLAPDAEGDAGEDTVEGAEPQPDAPDGSERLLAVEAALRDVQSALERLEARLEAGAASAGGELSALRAEHPEPDWEALRELMGVWYRDEATAREETLLMGYRDVLARFGKPSQVWGSADELNWLYVDGLDPITGETVTEVWFQFVDGFVTQLGVKQP
jgi:hypothetical protein